MADNEKQHEQDVIRAIDETTKQQQVSSEEQLAALQKTIDEALDALRRRRDELKKLLSEDEAAYAKGARRAQGGSYECATILRNGVEGVV